MCAYSLRHKLTLLLGLLLVLGLSIRTEAQVLYGSVTGNVTDASGAAVAGARVDAQNALTGVTQQTTSDQNGIYRFPEVRPGTYRISVSVPNFATLVIDQVEVVVNAVRRVDAQLQVAKVQQSVTVTAEAAVLQTDKADVHTDLQSTQIESLPAISSEGRSFQALYKIIPGFGLPGENNSAAGNPQRAMTAPVNGQSTQGNNTRIDGVQDAYPWLPNNIAYVPPVASIETVNVVTNSFDAEQGMVGGASVNVRIKSGSNQYHGDAREFHTDRSLKALNYFNPPTFKKPENIFNQFGASLGGPIKKDKVFFFGDWESTRQNQGSSGGNPQSVPAGGLTYQSAKQVGYFDFRPLLGVSGGLTDKNGNAVHIYDPRTGSPDGAGRSIISCNGVQDTICLSDVDPAGLAMSQLIPQPNQSGLTNNYLVPYTGFFHRDDFDTKVDYVRNDKSTLFGRYSLSQSYIFDPGALGPAEGNATLGGQLGNAYSRIQVVGLGLTHTFSPNLLLDMNGGFTRQRINAESTDIGTDFGLDTLKIPGTNGAGVLGPTTLYGGIPAFQFSTFSNLGNPNTGNPFVFRDNQYVGNANLTWSKGRHQLRFGIEYNHTQLNHFQPQGGSFQTARGSFRFTGAGSEQVTCTAATPPVCSLTDPPKAAQINSFADFLLGLPDEVGKAIQNNNPISLRWSQWGAYARDQYQINSKLTVDYGIRYEFYPMAYSDIGGARVLDPTTMNVLVGGGSSGIPTNDGVKVGHGLFLPRIGIAYRPLEKTVIRAGYGMSADPNNWRFLRNDFPAVTISDFFGSTYSQAQNSAYAPAASLTGLNATGVFSYLPAGITLIPLNGGTSPGIFPLPQNVGTSTVPKDFRRGYIHSFNLTLEREFAGFVADAGYVGNREIRPLTNMNINPAPGGGGTAGRILNKQFGKTWPDINELNPFGNNYYDSLQTKLTRKLGGSSLVGAVYTLSRTIDYEDSEELNALLFPYPAYWPLNKAVAGFDRTHNFEAYAVYELPFGRNQRWAQHGVVNAIAGGWQINAVFSAMSGTPFTITDSNGNLNGPGNTQTANVAIWPTPIINGQPPQTSVTCSPTTKLSCYYFDPLAFSRVAAPGVLGNAPRNYVRGPGLVNLDMSLFRDFRISERFKLEFQAQAFGVTNTPHFNNPTSDYNSGNFGRITSTLVTTNAGLGGTGGERQWWFGARLIF